MPLLSCPSPLPSLPPQNNNVLLIKGRGHQLGGWVFENTSRWKFIAAFIRPLHFYHLQAAFHASAATASLFPAHIQRVYSKSEQCQCQREQLSVKQCKSGDINVYFGLAAHICIIPSHLRCSTTWKMLGASNQKKAQILAVFRWWCCVAPTIVSDVVVQQLTAPAQHFHMRPLIKNVERQMYPLKSSKAFSPIRAMLPSMNISSWHSSTLLQAWV